MAAGRPKARDDKDAVSDVQLSSGLDAPDFGLQPSQTRPRRFRRFAGGRPQPQLRPAGITEGAKSQINVREGLYRRTLAVADAFAAVFALVIVVAWDAGAGLRPWVLAAAPIAVLVNKIGGLYERDELVLRKSTLDEAPALLQISGLFALIVFLGENRFVHAGMTPALVAELWLAAFLSLLTGRACARELAARLAKPERCLVMGDVEAIHTVTSKLEGADVNAQVVATVRLDPFEPRVDAERFETLVCAYDVHRVIVAPVTTDACDTLDLIRVAKAAGVRVSVLPRLFEVVGSAVEFDYVDGLTMLGIRRFGLSRSSHALKRAFDLAG
ncbi:MAG: hypothetical protein QOE28_1742, partial [Solirubrobacteraceae bacterium]|nr:hypothetical protein [Solirubrobacteraceae bacterium]